MDMAEFFQALGGQREIARRLQVAPSLPAQWIRRGNIPVTHWSGLLKMAEKKGMKVFIETIYRMCIDGK